MSLSKLPSGRWRAQVYNPATGKNESVGKILGLVDPTFATKGAAKSAREDARRRLQQPHSNSTTVREWWDIWTSDPLFERPKPSTNINNRERTQAFVEKYGHLQIAAVDDGVVAAWLRGGQHTGTVKCLRTMFADAGSVPAGRLIPSNPFARLGFEASKGNAEKDPPTDALVEKMLAYAWANTPAGFAAWLQVATATGMRHGELDALRWENVDLAGGWITVDAQLGNYCSKSGTFGAPKNGKGRRVPIHGPAADALARMAAPTEASAGSEFVFLNGVGVHWTRGSRAYQWNRVRKAIGWTESLYLATRHYAGSVMYNDLRLPAEDVAAALGHTDRGELVRKLYGHFRDDDALERVKAAYAARSNVIPLRSVS